MTAPPFENRYDLYEAAVQDPPREAAFLRAVHGGDPTVLAEDFSGPASICRAWIAMHQAHRAIATDLDREPLQHALRRLGGSQGAEAIDRLDVQCRDVLEAEGTPDIIAALNFAACELHRRERLVTYLRHAQFRLSTGGVLVLDTYGGPDAFEPGVTPCTVETEHGELLYEWEQVEANPFTARVRNAMHFTLPNGEVRRNAFEYDWRLWSVPELREAMREAGFGSTQVYTALGDAMTGEGELLVSPVSDDTEPEDEWSIGPDLDEESGYVAYVVGRV